MNHSLIKDFIDANAAGDVLAQFDGEINQARVTAILGEVETKLETSEEDFKKQRKVYNILVETLQNLYHHTENYSETDLDNGDNLKSARFVLARKDGEYNILAANYIEKDNISPLKARLDKVNGLDKDGLRSFYKEVLDNGQYSVHGGGGLGMIDIARKSGNKLDYNFADVTNDFGLFILKIKV